MRRELREEINGIARHFLKAGRPGLGKSARSCRRRPRDAGQKTRKGTALPIPCLGRGGRCKLHWRHEHGPRTEEGKARSLAAASRRMATLENRASSRSGRKIEGGVQRPRVRHQVRVNVRTNAWARAGA